MADNGDTKDDVKVPDGEVGEKIDKLFRVDEKDTSMYPKERDWDWQANRSRCYCPYLYGRRGCHRSEGGSSLLNDRFEFIFSSSSLHSVLELCHVLCASGLMFQGVTNDDVVLRPRRLLTGLR